MDYERIYNEFIADRRTREAALIASGEYCEKHHIIPRSMGGTDESDNLIALTARDHFFAHLCLAKWHGGRQWLGVAAMANLPGSSKKRDFFCRGRWVARAREEASAFRSAYTARMHAEGRLPASHSEETKVKVSKTLKARHAKNPELWANQREAMKCSNLIARRTKTQRQNWASGKYEGYRAVLSKKWKETNPMRNLESRAKSAAAVKAYRSRPEVRSAYSERMTGEGNPAKRAEVRSKMSESQKRAYEENPLKYAKTPVFYKGEMYSLRQAAKLVGMEGSTIQQRAVSENMSLQDAFDYYVNTTPEQRKADFVAKQSKAVRCIDTGKTFQSAKAAAKWAGVDPSGVTNTCKGKQNQSGGYRWAYAA